MTTAHTPRAVGASASRRTFLTGAGVLATAASGALLAACGRSSSSSAGSSAASGSAPAASSSSSASPLPSGSSVLVAYYSAQGHTKTVAETIAGELGASTFVIEPANPFSQDDLNWRDSSSRVVTEYENPDQRSTQLASNAPADFSSYDTVFVGYPIWWQSASWAMTDFARQNDFTGKTVIPFCTSLSSPLSSSGTELAEMAGGSGTWQEGIRFEENVSTEEVAQWARQFRP
ncbi:flavodoxin [Actinomyces sp. ZJ308]|uniref:flavodoxin n=1 Tax=Actinomyces sp. ZJ308 TaxID=2708342 RepID=UPI0014240B02|nr:flavodoxin [Actinomyces sp. ZJ308]